MPQTALLHGMPRDQSCDQFWLDHLACCHRSSACVSMWRQRCQARRVTSSRGGKVIGLEGDAPQRVIVNAFDTVEKAQAWRDSAAWKALEPLRAKSTKVRSSYIVGKPTSALGVAYRLWSLRAADCADQFRRDDQCHWSV
jgi:hypothetical protein